MYKMSADLYSNFLTQGEKQAIIGSYTRFLDLMKTEELMLLLVQNGHMTPFEKSDFKCKTENDKGQFIIDNVFLKSTYEQILHIKKCLLRSKVQSHIAIAHLLPSRGESLDTESDTAGDTDSVWNSPCEPQKVQPQDILKASGSSSDIHGEREIQPVSPTDDDDSPPSFDNPDKSIPPADLSISQVSSGIHTGNFDSVSPKMEALSLNPKNSSTQPKSDVNLSSPLQLVSKLGYYPVKDGNNPGTGEALVIVLANFTDDLFGYQKDIEDILAFFKDEMKYKHVYASKMGNTSLSNLCREEMLKVLKVIQDFLTNPMSGNSIDRFYLFLLSHGNEKGIMTCVQGSGHEIECDKDEEPIIITVDEIVEMFTHDKVPDLKGYPKVIFRQTCQGTEAMKAATIPSGPNVVAVPQTKLPAPGRPLAVGADVLICEATTLSYMSFVGDKVGSVFIQTALQAMKQHYKTDHLIDILGEVNRLVAVAQKLGTDPNSKKTIKAVQMPGLISRLTAKLYLKGPPGMFT